MYTVAPRSSLRRTLSLSDAVHCVSRVAPLQSSRLSLHSSVPAPLLPLRFLSSSTSDQQPAAGLLRSPYPTGRTSHLTPPTQDDTDTLSRYDRLRRDFTWPHVDAGLTHYNIGWDVCDKWAHSDKKHVRNNRRQWDELATTEANWLLSNRLCHALRDRLHLSRGSRVAILMAQSIEASLVHTSIYRSAAIAVPLSSMFGPEAIGYRVKDSGADVVFVEPAKLDDLLSLKAAGELPALRHIVVAPPLSAMRYQTVAQQVSLTSAAVPGAFSAWATTASPPPSDTFAQVHHLSSLLAGASSAAFSPVPTLLDDPALIIYTSGTTGLPKGALHAHRVLLGHMPGMEFPFDFLPDPDGRDFCWTPAEWAWIGGLLVVMLSSLHHGIPVLACRFRKFDPELAFRVIERRGIRNMFLPPTALKLLREVPNPQVAYPRMNVRSISSGGESLGESLLDWGREAFSGVSINELYGQTECNLVLANCSKNYPPRAGSMGKAVPGQTVHIVSEAGEPLPDGTVGHIGVLAPHPIMLLEYWNKPKATKDKFAGRYLLTGDLGKRDQDGYFWFFGRSDDVIKSSGYRIGPGEIEDCLLKHPAVSSCAVIGVPDPLRGERVKAYVVRRPTAMLSAADATSSDDALRASLAEHVKRYLAAYEYPREIEFIDALPMTTTGKIIRKDLKERHAQMVRQQQQQQQQADNSGSNNN